MNLSTLEEVASNMKKKIESVGDHAYLLFFNILGFSHSLIVTH